MGIEFWIVAMVMLAVVAIPIVVIVALVRHSSSSRS